MEKNDSGNFKQVESKKHITIAKPNQASSQEKPFHELDLADCIVLFSNKSEVDLALQAHIEIEFKKLTLAKKWIFLYRQSVKTPQGKQLLIHAILQGPQAVAAVNLFCRFLFDYDARLVPVFDQDGSLLTIAADLGIEKLFKQCLADMPLAPAHTYPFNDRAVLPLHLTLLFISSPPQPSPEWLIDLQSSCNLANNAYGENQENVLSNRFKLHVLGIWSLALSSQFKFNESVTLKIKNIFDGFRGNLFNILLEEKNPILITQFSAHITDERQWQKIVLRLESSDLLQMCIKENRVSESTIISILSVIIQKLQTDNGLITRIELYEKMLCELLKYKCTKDYLKDNIDLFRFVLACLLIWNNSDAFILLVIDLFDDYKEVLFSKAQSQAAYLESVFSPLPYVPMSLLALAIHWRRDECVNVMIDSVSIQSYLDDKLTLLRSLINCAIPLQSDLQGLNKRRYASKIQKIIKAGIVPTPDILLDLLKLVNSHLKNYTAVAVQLLQLPEIMFAAGLIYEESSHYSQIVCQFLENIKLIKVSDNAELLAKADKLKQLIQRDSALIKSRSQNNRVLNKKQEPKKKLTRGAGQLANEWGFISQDPSDCDVQTLILLSTYYDVVANTAASNKIIETMLKVELNSVVISPEYRFWLLKKLNVYKLETLQRYAKYVVHVLQCRLINLGSIIHIACLKREFLNKLAYILKENNPTKFEETNRILLSVSGTRDLLEIKEFQQSTSIGKLETLSSEKIQQYWPYVVDMLRKQKHLKNQDQIEALLRKGKLAYLVCLIASGFDITAQEFSFSLHTLTGLLTCCIAQMDRANLIKKIEGEIARLVDPAILKQDVGFGTILQCLCQSGEEPLVVALMEKFPEHAEVTYVSNKNSQDKQFFHQCALDLACEHQYSETTLKMLFKAPTCDFHKARNALRFVNQKGSNASWYLHQFYPGQYKWNYFTNFLGEGEIDLSSFSLIYLVQIYLLGLDISKSRSATDKIWEGKEVLKKYICIKAQKPTNNDLVFYQVLLSALLTLGNADLLLVAFNNTQVVNAVDEHDAWMVCSFCCVNKLDKILVSILKSLWSRDIHLGLDASYLKDHFSLEERQRLLASARLAGCNTQFVEMIFEHIVTIDGELVSSDADDESDAFGEYIKNCERQLRKCNRIFEVAVRLAFCIKSGEEDIHELYAEKQKEYESAFLELKKLVQTDIPGIDKSINVYEETLARMAERQSCLNTGLTDHQARVYHQLKSVFDRSIQTLKVDLDDFVVKIQRFSIKDCDIANEALMICHSDYIQAQAALANLTKHNIHVNFDSQSIVEAESNLKELIQEYNKAQSEYFKQKINLALVRKEKRDRVQSNKLLMLLKLASCEKSTQKIGEYIEPGQNQFTHIWPNLCQAEIQSAKQMLAEVRDLLQTTKAQVQPGEDILCDEEIQSGYDALEAARLAYEKRESEFMVFCKICFASHKMDIVSKQKEVEALCQTAGDKIKQLNLDNFVEEQLSISEILVNCRQVLSACRDQFGMICVLSSIIMASEPIELAVENLQIKTQDLQETLSSRVFELQDQADLDQSQQTQQDTARVAERDAFLKDVDAQLAVLGGDVRQLGQAMQAIQLNNIQVLLAGYRSRLENIKGNTRLEKIEEIIIYNRAFTDELAPRRDQLNGYQDQIKVVETEYDRRCQTVLDELVDQHLSQVLKNIEENCVEKVSQLQKISEENLTEYIALIAKVDTQLANNLSTFSLHQETAAILIEETQVVLNQENYRKALEKLYEHKETVDAVIQCVRAHYDVYIQYAGKINILNTMVVSFEQAVRIMDDKMQSGVALPHVIEFELVQISYQLRAIQDFDYALEQFRCIDYPGLGGFPTAYDNLTQVRNRLHDCCVVYQGLQQWFAQMQSFAQMHQQPAPRMAPVGSYGQVLMQLGSPQFAGAQSMPMVPAVSVNVPASAPFHPQPQSVSLIVSVKVIERLESGIIVIGLAEPKASFYYYNSNTSETSKKHNKLYVRVDGEIELTSEYYDLICKHDELSLKSKDEDTSYRIKATNTAEFPQSHLSIRQEPIGTVSVMLESHEPQPAVTP